MLRYSARQGAAPHNLPKVYYCSCASDDKKYFDMISEEVLELSNCTVWYKENNSEICDFDILEEMRLVIIPVTYALLTENDEVFDREYAFFRERHIATLPILLEPNLENLYEKKFGSIQYLSRISDDITEISYTEKLKKRLESVLASDETTMRIKDAFEGYIFVSYRKKDRNSAKKLMNLIHENDKLRDYATWYDEFLIPGENYNHIIQNALEKSDFFSLVVTPNVLEEDNYIITHEYPAARKLEKTVIPFEVISTDKDKLSEKYKDIPACVAIDDDKNIEKAFEGIVSDKKKISDAEHDYLIGLAYLTGTDVEMNKEKGVALIKGAAAEWPEAQEKLIDIYEMGDGVMSDLTRAAQEQSSLNSYNTKHYEDNPTEEKALLIAHGLLKNAQLMELDVANPKKAISAYKKAVDFLESSNEINFTAEKLSLILNTCVRITELQIARNGGDATGSAIWYYNEYGHKADSPDVRKALCKVYITHGDYETHYHYDVAGLRAPEIPLDESEIYPYFYESMLEYHKAICGKREFYEKARDILEELLETESSDSLIKEKMRISLRECRYHYAFGEFAAAEEKAKNAVAVLSDMAFSSESVLLGDAYEQAGLSCLFQGKHDEALELYSKAFSILYRVSEKSEKRTDYSRTYYNAYLFVCAALLCGSDLYKKPLEEAKRIYDNYLGVAESEMCVIYHVLCRAEKYISDIDRDIDDIGYVTLLLKVFLADSDWFLSNRINGYTDLFIRRTESCYVIFALSMKAFSHYKEAGDEEKAEKYYEFAKKAFSYLENRNMISVNIVRAARSEPEFAEGYTSLHDYWEDLFKDSLAKDVREKCISFRKEKEEYDIGMKEFEAEVQKQCEVINELDVDSNYINELKKESFRIAEELAECEKAIEEFKDHYPHYYTILELFLNNKEQSEKGWGISEDVEIVDEALAEEIKRFDFNHYIGLIYQKTELTKKSDEKIAEMEKLVCDMTESNDAICKIQKKLSEEAEHFKKKKRVVEGKNSERFLSIMKYLDYFDATMDELVEITDEDEDYLLSAFETHVYTENGKTVFKGEKNKALRDTPEYEKAKEMVIAYLTEKGEATFDEIIKVIGEKNRVYFRLMDFFAVKHEIKDGIVLEILSLKSDKKE